MSNKLIVLEGIDCSGKTSIAKAVAKAIGYKFEHEPTFSSEYADKLNYNKLNGYQREFYFLIDRYNHQKILNENNIVLDRYRLSGSVYSSVFSPEILPMVHSIYVLPEFKKPDLTIFVDIDPCDALKLNELKRGRDDYNPKLSLEILNKLRDAFLDQINVVGSLWGEKIITVKNTIGKFDSIVNEIKNIIFENNC